MENNVAVPGYMASDVHDVLGVQLGHSKVDALDIGLDVLHD